MAVRAEIDGHEYDLEVLASQYPTGDPRVVKNERGVFLEASDLENLCGVNTQRLVAAADRHLTKLNGFLLLFDSQYRRVRLSNRFERDGGSTMTYRTVSDTARA